MRFGLVIDVFDVPSLPQQPFTVGQQPIVGGVRLGLLGDMETDRQGFLGVADRLVVASKFTAVLRQVEQRRLQ